MNINNVPKLTKEQAAIIGLYTGVTCSNFSYIHEYAEQKLGRPIFTHDFANESLMTGLKNLTKEDFLAICAE
jgi:hypothetical protein